MQGAALGEHTLHADMFTYTEEKAGTHTHALTWG